MVGLPWTFWRFFTTVVLALGGLAAFLLALPAIGRLWTLIFVEARSRLFPGTPLGDQTLAPLAALEFSLPVLALPTPAPDIEALLLTSAVTAAVVLATFLLTPRWTPLRYFLRLLAFLQATAVAFFALWPGGFPYRLIDHVQLLMVAGLVVMALVPLVLGFTLHVFDLALWRKVLLTLAVLIHLAGFIPLKVLVHGWLVVHGTAVLMPMLFLVFGLLLDVFVFVAFYGWALSWKSELEQREELPPVHLVRRAE